MTRPNRRMFTLPTAQEFNQGANGIRLHKKRDRFLFMTYNLLAQALVRRDMFPHASQKALRWKFRRQNLLQEFLAFSPDLACLQEVDFWEEFYHPALTKAGYDTIYYKNENKKHGCAIIWRKTRFEKMEQLTLEYDEHGQPTFTTGNVGLMVALQPLQQKGTENPDPNADMILPEDDDAKSGDNLTTEDEKDEKDEKANIPGGILVATTHLFWRPDGSYERLRQASIFLEKVHEWNKHLNFTVLVGGDFNTTPRDAAYRAMTRNEMPPQQIPNLEKWLVDEVSRVQEAEVNATAEATKTDQQDPVEQLTTQTAKLGLEPTTNESTTSAAETDKSKDADLPYRAPHKGIMLPKQIKTTTKTAVSDGTVASAAELAASEDPKIKKLVNMAPSSSVEDAPVVAPLEAFTSPKDLMAKIESYSRCISIYGQYETLLKDYPAEVNTSLVAETVAIESTATLANEEHVHGEPIFTNFATWFKDTLDYVYLLDEPVPQEGARLVPLKLLEIPDKSFLGHGLPDENFSSDHICLVVEFAILSK